MLPPRSACLCAVFPSLVHTRSPEGHHCVDSLSRGILSYACICRYVCCSMCMYVCAYVCMLPPCSACSCPVHLFLVRCSPGVRAPMLTRRASLRRLVLEWVYCILCARHYVCICMYVRTYVCILPPCPACSCPVRPLLVLACSPAVHKTTCTRLSMLLHPCLYAVKGLRVDKMYIARSRVQMCMYARRWYVSSVCNRRAPPARALSVCCLQHACTIDIRSSASVSLGYCVLVYVV